MKTDKFTQDHLRAWCMAQFSSGASEVCALMLSALEAMEDDDRKFALERGWWKLFDSLPVSRDFSAGYRIRFDNRGLQCGIEG